MSVMEFTPIAVNKEASVASKIFVHNRENYRFSWSLHWLQQVKTTL